MTDKWEMCWIEGSDNLWFASPGEVTKKMKMKEYLKTKGMSNST